MTVADPHGAFRDNTRTCYESWMVVPDAPQPIRVRWYAVPRPAPGVYDVSDYCSSDWDEDPKSLDPDVGEQSTTRSPWTDWRDCLGPPFPPPPLIITGAGFTGFPGIQVFPSAVPMNGPHRMRADPYPAWTFRIESIVTWSWTAFFVGPVTRIVAIIPVVTPTPKGVTVSITTVNPFDPDQVPIVLTWKGVPSLVTRPLPLSSATYSSPAWDDSTITVPGYSFLQENDVFIGQTFAYAGTGALPPRCLECNGARYLQSAYPELFGVIGFTYGPDNGDGTFAVPDDRDKVIYGAGLTYAVGQAVGNDSPTLTANQLPTHTHPVVVTDPGHNHTPFNPNKWLVHRNNAGGTAENGPAFSGTGPMGTDGVVANANTGITAVGGNNATTGQPLDVRQYGIARRSVIYAGR